MESIHNSEREILALACVALIASSAFGQIKPEEQSIEQAFEGLRPHPGLQITHTGSTHVGPSELTFKSISTLFQDVEDGRPMIKVEMVIFVNDLEIYRIVGDGVTLYAYDERRNQYSASRYGTYNGAQPAAYINSLLSTLRSLLQGNAVFPGRIFSEVYAGEDARYTSWIPGTAVENTGTIVRYVLGNPVHRSLEFSYSNIPPNVVLNSIEYFDHVDLGAVSRDNDWTITLQSFDLALSDVTFSFVPPAGATFRGGRSSCHRGITS